LVLARNHDATIALYVGKEQVSAIVKKTETIQSLFIKLDETW